MSDRTVHILGWVLFIFSAVGFIVSGLKSGDLAALIGSVLFLIACLVFLLPLVRSPRS
jgi:hypothetical protein